MNKKIIFLKSFKKNYQKRIAPKPKLVDKFKKRLLLFTQNPKNPILRTHHLKGEMSSHKSFSITGDIRVVYTETKNEIKLYDIGSHNQVY